MKAHETGSSSQKATAASVTGDSKKCHEAEFKEVVDGRKQPIKLLCQRNGRIYARLKVENPITGIKSTKRIPLTDKDGNPVSSAADAKLALARLQTQRVDNALPVLSQNEKFRTYAARYLTSIEGKKSEGTIEKERVILDRWADKVGELRLDQIKRVHVNRFIDGRIKDKAAARTVNLDVIAFRCAMKKAFEDGLIQRLPTEGLRPLKTTTVKRALFSSADLETLCAAAFETKQNGAGEAAPLTQNAQLFVDYVRLMAYSGTRRNEALGIQWADVDADGGQLFVRRQIKGEKECPLKNKEQRVVDFNPKLRAHLADMQQRYKNASKWLFPSPQRGDKDIPARTFRESLELVRTRAKMPTFGFHDCRHHFISMCVMSGIDFMTIAAWVGHKDGGVLIGKVYGHLANDHRKAMADKLNFGPVLATVSA